MNYRDKLKRVETCKTIFTGKVDKDFIEQSIRCQYNPERFNAWKSLYKKGFARSEMLKVKHSPHHSFIYWNKRQVKSPDKTMYYKMHELYGRNFGWIVNKTLKFQDLIKDVKEKGIKEPVVLLNEPLVENEYNNLKLEIYEGHHRCAIAYYFGIDLPIIIKDVSCIN